MKVIFFIVILFIATSCSLSILGGPLSKIKNFIKEKYDVIPTGISEQGMEGKYEEFGISFRCYKSFQKREAISFVNNIYQDLIEKANQYPSLQKEFVEQPISKKRVFIKVFFSNERYEEYHFPLVSICKAYENNFELAFKRFRYGNRASASNY